MAQIPLPFSSEPHYADGNFFVSGANEAAWEQLMAWPNWPARAMVLFGEAGSGKTHLAHIWAARAQAHILTASTLQTALADVVGASTAWLIEEADAALPERPLLHVLNSLKEADGWLLMTSRLPPSRWAYVLPDLTSRLQALPVAQLLPPDEALLQNIIAKQFADRQLHIGPEVVAYILAHAERSIAAISALAEYADRRSLADKRAVTVGLIRDIMNDQRDVGEEAF